MPVTYAGKPSSFYKATGGKPEEGAYYSGQRYLGGKLLALGEHQPGQQVSKEVIAQTAPENVEYIQQLRKQQQPKTTQEVTSYLDNYQNALFNGQEKPATRTPEDLKALLPSSPYPDPLKRVERFEGLRTELGVADLEKSGADLKAQIDEEYAVLRERREAQRGKGVALNVVAGRIGEIERQGMERIDYLGRQSARINDELTTKYNLIQNYMNLETLDYQDAVAKYEGEFKRNLQIYDIIYQQERDVRSDFESDRNAASANLQIYMNAIAGGNLDYASLGEDQKIMINKLEAQSGIPIGFMSSLRMDPGVNILFNTSNEGITQIGFLNPDNTVTTKSYGTRISGSGEVSDKKRIREQFDIAVEANDLPDLIYQFANKMTLSEIYSAYGSTGNKPPTEDPFEIQLLYKWRTGEITEEEYRNNF